MAVKQRQRGVELDIFCGGMQKLDRWRGLCREHGKDGDALSPRGWSGESK